MTKARALQVEVLRGQMEALSKGSRTEIDAAPQPY